MVRPHIVRALLYKEYLRYRYFGAEPPRSLAKSRRGAVSE